MKKIIVLIITVLLLVSCFSLPVFADKFSYYDYEYTTTLDPDVEITFSEDFKTLYFGEDKYVIFDNKNIYNDVLVELENNIKLTDAQNAKISKIELTTSEEGALIDAAIKYIDGIYMEMHFINEEYFTQYNDLLTSKTAQYEVNFMYPEGNSVEISRDKLSGNEIILRNFDNNFDVIGKSKDGRISVAVGLLIICNEEFYYLDYSEAGSNYRDYSIYGEEIIKAHEITDPDVIAALKEAETSYYTGDYGFFLDDNFTKNVADIFLVIVFAVIPFAVLVIFTIFAYRSKGIYRKMNSLIAILCAAELVIFTIIALLIT